MRLELQSIYINNEMMSFEGFSSIATRFTDLKSFLDGHLPIGEHEREWVRQDTMAEALVARCGNF